jgi:coproporphyrinogen III oxidase-like Fe-S oxidoreductase
MERLTFDEFFQTVPPEVEVETIRQEWLALTQQGGAKDLAAYCLAERHLPLPVWARRPFTESGDEAWQTLREDVPTIDPQRAFCVYIHIPFCPERCHFCDCYSFRLASHRERHVDGYLELLAREMDLWSQLGTLARRPVSTVHLGGGTPTFLDPESFQHLVGDLRTRFALDQPVGSGQDPDARSNSSWATEWALESTASELSPQMLACLDSLGFTRLHVGVQSLQDEVRQRLNRRTTARTVLDIIEKAVERGWIVSVDLIYGLPGQTLNGLLNDIRALVAAGVNGFSLYELQLSSRNRKFAQRYGLVERDRQINYFLAQSAGRFLAALGYRKTLFNHFADDRDTNLYFTFPARGEDCLALGTIADGSFGDYHYRHPEYALYCKGVGDVPGLQGGLRRTPLENYLQPLTIALLAGCVPPELFADPVSRSLLSTWQGLRLLGSDPLGGDLHLTGNGSWLVGNMISQMIDRYRQSESRGYLPWSAPVG